MRDYPRRKIIPGAIRHRAPCALATQSQLTAYWNHDFSDNLRRDHQKIILKIR
jgi:hypothetical protein